MVLNNNHTAGILTSIDFRVLSDNLTELRKFKFDKHTRIESVLLKIV